MSLRVSSDRWLLQRREEKMAYMMMLIADDIEQLNAVLKAWESIHVDDIVVVDSTCFHRGSANRPHIPMRFMFERLDHGQRQRAVTLFGVVKDEARVQQCIVLAEGILGDFDIAKNAMLVAWPLPIVKGFPRQNSDRGEVGE
jgi:hypothetical protein